MRRREHVNTYTSHDSNGCLTLTPPVLDRNTPTSRPTPHTQHPTPRYGFMSSCLLHSEALEGVCPNTILGSFFDHQTLRRARSAVHTKTRAMKGMASGRNGGGGGGNGGTGRSVLPSSPSGAASSSASSSSSSSSSSPSSTSSLLRPESSASAYHREPRVSRKQWRRTGRALDAFLQTLDDNVPHMTNPLSRGRDGRPGAVFFTGPTAPKEKKKTKKSKKK